MGSLEQDFTVHTLHTHIMTDREDSGGISATPPGPSSSSPNRSDTTECEVTNVTTTKWDNSRIHELRTPPKSQRRQIDFQQLQAGQKVVKKYRKYARNAEFRRLKAIVPS